MEFSREEYDEFLNRSYACSEICNDAKSKTKSYAGLSHRAGLICFICLCQSANLLFGYMQKSQIIADFIGGNVLQQIASDIVESFIRFSKDFCTVISADDLFKTVKS